MAQANAIVVRIRKEQQQEFERLFEEEEVPLWDEFTAAGKFLKARMARVEYGTEEREGVVAYLIYAEVPGMAEHGQHDRDPRFLAYVEKARAFQPEPPLVFGGDILFSREAS
ncbi:MAG: hypothetical protein M3135_04370 [Actinomycetota bacterium]|nr:hypothetical protein [Actinomycetota bacterium]